MSGTLKIDEVARLLGISKNSAYQAAQSGSIVGIPVLRVGRRLLLPRRPLLDLLGVDEGPAGIESRPE